MTQGSFIRRCDIALLLTRKIGESVIVGDNLVTITLVDIRGDKARIGITADKSISVHREEVFKLLQEQKKLREQQQRREQREKGEPPC